MNSSYLDHLNKLKSPLECLGSLFECFQQGCEVLDDLAGLGPRAFGRVAGAAGALEDSRAKGERQRVDIFAAGHLYINMIDILDIPCVSLTFSFTIQKLSPLACQLLSELVGLEPLSFSHNLTPSGIVGGWFEMVWSRHSPKNPELGR